jgi:4-amino-4-deoxy-L-arabinose transferase-like glycosyltransferase
MTHFLTPKHANLLAGIALAIALAIRIFEAARTYLNPDELLHLSFSDAVSFAELYQKAAAFHHPALFASILYAFRSLFGDSELVLRSVPVIAGAVFPWFLYRWLSLIWNHQAGLIALLLAAFAPHLVSLSAQVRSYTLAFACIFCFLYLQERAVRESSPRFMAGAMAALWIAILSEYFTAFIALTAGLAFLYRIWKDRMPRKSVLIVWTAGQTVGVAIYAFLFVTQIRPMLSNASGDTASHPWLRSTFPWPGDNLFAFLAESTIGQFAWIFASLWIGRVMLLPFLLGLALLWLKEKDLARQTTAAMIVTMFALAAAASIAHVHPYGRSRHTAFLGLFAIAVIAIALDYGLRYLPLPNWTLVPLIAAGIVEWHLGTASYAHDIPSTRNQRSHLLANIQVLTTQIPPGSAILIDTQTRQILDYYRAPLDRFRVVTHRFNYSSVAQVREDNQKGACDWFIKGGWILPRFENRNQERAARAAMLNRNETLWMIPIAPLLLNTPAP